MKAKSERRKLVNAGVAAGSAVMFAAAWVGIVRADAAATPVTVEVPSSFAANVGTAAGSSTLTQPPAVSRVVVVRRSRAS